MITVLDRSPTVDSTPVLRPPTGATARTLALAYLRYASACWRGDPRAAVFATQLSAYSRSDMPPMPALPAAAVSPHGGSGRGIHWYQTADEVIGYIPGTPNGYRVPRAVISRFVRCTSAAGGTIPLDLAPRTIADARGEKRSRRWARADDPIAGGGRNRTGPQRVPQGGSHA